MKVFEDGWYVDQTNEPWLIAYRDNKAVMWFNSGYPGPPQLSKIAPEAWSGQVGFDQGGGYCLPAFARYPEHDTRAIWKFPLDQQILDDWLDELVVRL